MATIEAARLIVAFEATGVTQITGAVDTVDRKIRNSAASAKAGGAALAGMASAAAIGFKKAIGVTADFDAQLSGIASVGGKEALERIGEIREMALKLGADTAFSASEAASGMQELIKAGLPVTDVLGGAAQAALDLSAATGTAVPRSATIMATALNVFSDSMVGFATEGDKAIHVANLFGQVSNASAADVDQLGLAFGQAATVADMFGISVDDLIAGLGLLHNAGIVGSDAGTSIKQMLLSLTRQTVPAQEALAALGLSFDSFFDSAGQFIGIEAMFETFRVAMERNGYTAQQINDTFAQIFGSDAVRAASAFFETGTAGWDAMRVGMSQAGTVQEQAAVRLDNLRGDVEQLSGSIETLTIRFTSFTTGPLRGFVQMGTRAVNFLNGLPPSIQQTIVLLAGLATVLGGAVGVWALFGNQIMTVVRGLALLSGPLLLLTGLVVGLHLAWQNNWGGIQEITERVLGSVGETLTRMTRFFQAAKDRGLTPFRLAFRTLIVSLSERIGDDHPIITFLRGILRNGERLAGWITSDFTPTFEAFLQLFSRGDFALAGSLLDHMLADLKGGWDRTVGPWLEERKADALAFAGGFVQSIVTGFRGINWDLVGNQVMTGFQTALGVLGGLSGWVRDRIAEIDWTGIGATLQTGAQIAAHGIIVGAQNGLTALGQLGSWVGTKLGEIDWTSHIETLKTRGGDLIGGLLTGARTAVDTTLFPGFRDAFHGLVLWLSNDGLPTIVARMVTGGAEVIGGLVQGLWDHKQEIFDFFTTTLIPGILGAMLLAPTLLVAAGAGIIRGLIAGASQVWNTQLGPWFEERKAKVAENFLEAGTWINAEGEKIIEGFLVGAAAKWATVTAWFGERKTAVEGFFTKAVDWLASSGATLISGLHNGVTSFWDTTITPWFAGMKQSVIDFFGPDPATWLTTTGSSILDGLRHGIQDYWNNTLTPWMGGMKDAFLGFFPNAGEWLVGVGGDIIGGLKQGVEDGWTDFSGWFGEQIGKLPGVGEEAVDARSPARAFMPLGQYMVQGIAAGAEAEMPAIERRFQRLMEGLEVLPVGETFDRFSERASAMMQHFWLVISQQEPHSDALGRFKGRMREAMIAVGEDMSDGLFTGWETYEQQFGSRVVDKLQRAFGRVAREMGISGQEINQILAHLGVEGGERFAGSVERGVRRGTREVEIAGPVFRSLGRNTSQSLATGFEERSSELGDAIRSTVDQAIASMKRQLGIASPSRLFRWFGQMSLGGMIAGWRSQQGAFLGMVDGTLRSTVGLVNQYGARIAGTQWGGPAFAGAMAGPSLSVAPRTVAPVAPATAAAGGERGTVVHQTNHITVSLREIEEMVEAGRFVRDLDTARTLYLGVS